MYPIKTQRQGQLRIFWLCWISYALSYLCRTNLSIALPQMSEQFEWSKTSAGLIGSMFFWSYAIGHLVNGIIGDKLRIRNFLTFGLFGSSVLNLMMGIFPNYFVITAVWTLNGFLLSTLWGPTVRALAIWYPEEKRNTPAVWMSASATVGYLISWAGLGLLIHYTNWKWAFFLPGMVTLVYSVIFFLWMNDRPEDVSLTDYSRNSLPKETGAPAPSVSFRELFRKESLFYFCLAAVSQGIIKDGITLWAPTMLTDLHKASASLISVSSALIPVLSVFGAWVAGLFIKLHHGDLNRAGTVLFTITGLACTLFCLLIGKSIWVDVALMGMISCLLHSINTILLTFIPLRFAACGRSSGVAGIFNFCAYLGAGTSGIFSGILVDHFSWSVSILFWLLLCLLGIISMGICSIRSKTSAQAE